MRLGRAVRHAAQRNRAHPMLGAPCGLGEAATRSYVSAVAISSCRKLSASSLLLNHRFTGAPGPRSVSDSAPPSLVFPRISAQPSSVTATNADLSTGPLTSAHETVPVACSSESRAYFDTAGLGVLSLPYCLPFVPTCVSPCRMLPVAKYARRWWGLFGPAIALY
jgi:hypothetical protein